MERNNKQWKLFQDLVEKLSAESSSFAIRYKNESKYMKLLGFILFFNRGFMGRYTTTSLGKVFFPSRNWLHNIGPTAAYLILRHEAVHIKDARRFPIFFQLSYLLLLPSIFTFRALWEWRAYKETLRVFYELYGFNSEHEMDRIVYNFTSSNYLYMFPFRRFLEKRVSKFVKTLDKET